MPMHTGEIFHAAAKPAPIDDQMRDSYRDCDKAKPDVQLAPLAFGQFERAAIEILNAVREALARAKTRRL